MIINQRKGNTLLTAVVCLIVLAMFTFIAVYDVRQIPHDSAFWDNDIFYWFFRVLCIVLIPFVLLAFVWSVTQLFSKKPIIEINDNALIDNSSATSVGEILWEDIERVYVKGMFLVLVLKDPNKYLSRMGAIKKLFAKANRALGYDCICITTQRFKKQTFDFLCAVHERKPIPGFDDVKRQVELNGKDN